MKYAAGEEVDVAEYAYLTEPTEEELINDEIYNALSNALPKDYLIDVQTYRESKEAIEEGMYNSRESVYFGYLLSEVDAEFQDIPYVFTTDDTGETIVREMVPYDDTWRKVLTNAAIGTGVILVCVTVAALTPTAAPAVHMVFAFARDYAIKAAATGALTGSIQSAVLSYFATGDLEETLKSAAVGASEGYKWGAIAGSVSGAAAKTINLAGLKRATKMKMNDLAEIQMNSNFSDAIIRHMHSLDEFDVYKNAKLTEYEFGGRRFLLPEDMDWDFVDPATGLTNRQLVHDGYNPVDANGIKYELHHVGQQTNSPLALLTKDQHHSNDQMLHPNKTSVVRPNGDNSFWTRDKEHALEALSLLLDLIL